MKNWCVTHYLGTILTKHSQTTYVSEVHTEDDATRGVETSTS